MAADDTRQQSEPEPEPEPEHQPLDAPAVPFIERRRSARPRVESLLVRFVATVGVVGLGVALAAILGTQDIQAWIIGLAVAVLTVVLAAVLWSSRTL